MPLPGDDDAINDVATGDRWDTDDLLFLYQGDDVAAVAANACQDLSTGWVVEAASATHLAVAGTAALALALSI
jgi:hypothetical protein